MREITSQELIERIFQADKEELRKVMDAVTERFAEVWPDCALMIMSGCGHTAEAFLQALDKARTVYEGGKQSGHEQAARSYTQRITSRFSEGHLV